MEVEGRSASGECGAARARRRESGRGGASGAGGDDRVRERRRAEGDSGSEGVTHKKGEVGGHIRGGGWGPGETVLERDRFYSLFISFALTSETTTHPRMIKCALAAVKRDTICFAQREDRPWLSRVRQQVGLTGSNFPKNVYLSLLNNESPHRLLRHPAHRHAPPRQLPRSRQDLAHSPAPHRHSPLFLNCRPPFHLQSLHQRLTRDDF